MRKPICFAVIVCLLVLTFVGSGLRADDKKKSTVAAAVDKPLLFVNTDSSIGQLVAVNVGLKQLVAIAEELGYRIDQGFRPSITDADLEGVSVYLLTSPDFILLDSDKEALKRFMRKGGAVVACPWWNNLSNFDGLFAEFGIGSGQYIFPFGRVAQVPAGSPFGGPNPVTQGIKASYIREILVVDPTYLTSVGVYDDGTQVGVISNHPNLRPGILLALGSLSVFCDPSVGGDINQLDGEAFTRNMLTYLLPSCDLKVKKLTWKGPPVGPGDDLKVVLKALNIGTHTSAVTKVRFALYEQGAAPAADALYTWKDQDFAAIDGGKKTKISTLLKIPGFLAAGTYVLKVEIDPGELARDKDRTNNEAASKRLVVVM